LGIVPWSSYLWCGASRPDALPPTVRIGLYEEHPLPERLAKLGQLDFPIRLALAAPSRAEFLALRDAIAQIYPQVREVYFWPVLALGEGYYPWPHSDAAAVERMAREAEGLPVLWDLEPSRGAVNLSLDNWRRNHLFMDRWLGERDTPVQLWRTFAPLGLNPIWMRLTGTHFDPGDYPTVSLQLDLYTRGDGLPSAILSRVLRCGVERYGERFIPAFGVLNDGLAADELFVSPATLRRYLQLAREAGVAEVWLFGVNGLDEEYLAVLRETLPLAPLGQQP
jgi:hypothetical protein